MSGKFPVRIFHIKISPSQVAEAQRLCKFIMYFIRVNLSCIHSKVLRYNVFEESNLFLNCDHRTVIHEYSWIAMLSNRPQYAATKSFHPSLALIPTFQHIYYPPYFKGILKFSHFWNISFTSFRSLHHSFINSFILSNRARCIGLLLAIDNM